MLTDNQRRVVEGVRRCGSITVVADDARTRTSFEVRIKDKGFSHDIAIAIQKWYNEQNS